VEGDRHENSGVRITGEMLLEEAIKESREDSPPPE